MVKCKKKCQLVNNPSRSGKCKEKNRLLIYDLYDVFCAVLYMLRGGVQWRMLPADFPS